MAKRKAKKLLDKIMTKTENKETEFKYARIDSEHVPYANRCPNVDCKSDDVYYNEALDGVCLVCGMEWAYVNGEVAELTEDKKSSYLSSEYDDVKKFIDAPEEKKSDIQKQIEEKLGIKQKSLPGFQHKAGTSNYDTADSSGMSKWVRVCTHEPTKMLQSHDDTWGVWVGKKDDVRKFANNFDVILNLTFTSICYPHTIPIPALQKYERVGANFIECQIDWPDFSIPDLPRQFWVDMYEYIKAEKKKLLIFCQGGHGRTGTALACMFVVAGVFTADESIKWIRESYCESAIESMSQETYIRRMDTNRKAKAN